MIPLPSNNDENHFVSFRCCIWPYTVVITVQIYIWCWGWNGLTSCALNVAVVVRHHWFLSFFLSVTRKKRKVTKRKEEEPEKNDKNFRQYLLKSRLQSIFFFSATFFASLCPFFLPSISLLAYFFRFRFPACNFSACVWTQMKRTEIYLNQTARGST